MTINLSNIDITVDTFSVMVTRINQMADGFKNHTVTVDTSASGNNSSGNGFITGIFGANTLVVGTGLRGGSVNQSANLNVISNTTFQSNVVFLSTVTLSSNLVSNAYVSFANTISVTGNSRFSNTVSVTGNAIFSNTLTVTGNTTLANSLIVLGNTALSNTLTVTGNAIFSNTLAVTGNSIFSNTVSVTGNTTLANTLTVTGNTTITGNTNLNSTLNVTGNTTLANTLAVTGNVRFSNTLSITGNATFSNTITVTGNATFTNTVTINTLIVTGNTNIDTGTLFIDNINDRIGIGNTSPDAKLTVTGAANVSGNVTIGGGLTVVGNTIFDDKVIFLTDIEMYNGRFISPVWIQTSDANAAIKITQAGSGHAIYVEDETSPDSTPTVITNSGNFVAGANAAIQVGTVAKVQSLVSFGGSFLAAATANLNNQGARYIFYKTRSGNVETYSAVSNGDQIGRLDFYADDGGQPIEAARIMVMNNGTPGPNSMPSALHFYTTGESSNNALISGPRLSIVANGNVGVGIGTPTEKLYINGNLRTIGNAVFSDQVTITGNTTIDSGTFILDTTLNTVGIGAPTPNTKLSVAGPIALSVPVKVSATSYTVTTTDASIIFDTTANCNVVMPAAATYPGRILYVKTIAARTINSTSASIKPIDSNTAANNILTNVAGKFAMLQSDGNNWVIMMNN